jgi:hypothetical protein
MDSDDGALRKPRGIGEDGQGGRPRRSTPVAKKRVPGPRCPQCHHGNPTTRVRCEVCGQELWRGGASTLAPAPAPPPPPPEPEPRGGSGRVLALVLVPVAVICAVFVLAYLLG